MKPIHMLCLTLLSSVAAHAQELSAGPSVSPARKTVLGVSVTPDELGVVTLEGERVVSPRVSVGLGLRTGFTQQKGWSDSLVSGERENEAGSSTFVLGVGPRARFFLVGDAPEGLWVSPGLEVTRSWRRFEIEGQASLNDNEQRIWSFGATAMLGYTVILGRGLAVQAGVGAEARHDSSQYTSNVTAKPGYEGLFPVGEQSNEGRSWVIDERLALSLGWAF
ncbi:hypothetical protein HUA76_05050 [Myxococcus sp. CA056]|uniref:hypothetical protein n=1 Tax=Myxococcus sp. CA056 TaxID=2741740 RepID=UPI00157B3D20|nr:hypothetical protein [Myxococcus sp. CA056]NTX10142.1 hypothetical protein [Myxococcus sp. CA056]